MTEPLWTGRPDPPPTPVPVKGRWPRKSVLAAFSLIPIGFMMWYGGLGVGLGGGDAWIVHTATFCFITGLPIAGLGFTLLLLIAITDSQGR
jgi:hypothetical protein